MNKKVCMAIAALLTLMLLFFIYIQIYGGKKDEYRIVCLGDSIIGNVRDETSVTSVMEEILNEPVLNGALGGTCMSKSNVEHRNTFYEDSVNMCAIADAIAYNDFSVQLFDISGNTFALDYFKEALQELAKVDFSEVEILFIEHATNDYNAGRPLDNLSDPYDVYTYGGALRYSIEKIKETYPDMKIVLVTPTYCYFQSDGQRAGDSENSDFGYGPLENYANLQIQIAGEYGLDVVDDFHNLGINAQNVDEYTEDGLHLNEKGRALMAKAMADYVTSIDKN